MNLNIDNIRSQTCNFVQLTVDLSQIITLDLNINVNNEVSY